MRLAVTLCLIALPAFADIEAVVSDHILPRHATLAEATNVLAQSAAEDCTPEALRPAFHAAYDRWIGVSHIQFGPLEDQGLALAMAYWPDTKDSTGKALARLSRAADPAVQDPAAFAEVSAAAQGFTALERVLFEPQPDADYACDLVRAIANGLADRSNRLATAWPAFAALMQSAGAAGNTRFQSAEEAERALYTALTTGLEFLHDQRLGRPLGSFERPRPLRAEARRSGRSLRHIVLSLQSLEELTLHLADHDIPDTRAAFARALSRAEALDDPALAGVSNPAARFRVEALQQAVRDLQVAVVEEIGTGLGAVAGFNALDGD